MFSQHTSALQYLLAFIIVTVGNEVRDIVGTVAVVRRRAVSSSLREEVVPSTVESVGGFVVLLCA